MPIRICIHSINADNAIFPSISISLSLIFAPHKLGNDSTSITHERKSGEIRYRYRYYARGSSDRSRDISCINVAFRNLSHLPISLLFTIFSKNSPIAMISTMTFAVQMRDLLQVSLADFLELFIY